MAAIPAAEWAKTGHALQPFDRISRSRSAQVFRAALGTDCIGHSFSTLLNTGESGGLLRVAAQIQPAVLGKRLLQHGDQRAAAMDLQSLDVDYR